MAESRRIEKRAIATAFVHEVNARTHCAHCGSQPIEWHNPDHIKKPNARVSALRTQGVSIERIAYEMEVSVPLCRICHMVEDGRIEKLMASAPRQAGMVFTAPKPCTCCGKLTKPPRNGMCVTCDNHHSGRRVRKTRSCCGCC